MNTPLIVQKDKAIILGKILAKRKKQCIKQNNITVLKNKEIKKYKKYCTDKYGYNFYKEYKI